MIVKNITNSIIPLQFDVLEYVASDDIYGFTSKFARDVYFTNGLYEIDDESKDKHDTDDFQLFETESPEIDATKDLLICYTSEKGSFFLGYVELEGEFDLTKLKIVISDIEVGDVFYFGEIISSVLYDGEELDNWGGDTDGKSFDIFKNF